MKKKICMLILSVCMVASLSACGSKSEKTEDSTKTESNAEDAESASGTEGSGGIDATADTRIVSISAKDMDKYITLGEYKGIAVEESVDEVTDDQVDSQISTTLQSKSEEVTDAEATIQDGDIANINYIGTKDGEAFDGGTADNYDLTIGSGSFIEGFEEGLIGAKKGETKELNLTFPEEYPSEDLAGQSVIFSVTVNSIKRMPELSDEWVAANTEYKTVDEYKEGVRADLEATNQESANTTALNNAWSQVIEASEVKEYPQDDIDQALEEYQASLKKYADQQSMTTDEFLESQGMTQETFDEQCQDYAKDKVKQNLAVQAIMDAEGFNLVDEKSTAAVEELKTNFGVDDLSTLVDEYGQAAINETIALSRVSEFVMDNAKVSTSIATEDDKEGFDADAAEEAANAESDAE